MEPESQGAPKSSGQPAVNFVVTVGITLAEMEKLLIEATLRWTGGNRKRTANILGIDRTTLYNKMRRHGLSQERGTDAERLGIA
jgi:DNA-binding NtrC family response regulator